MSKSHGKAGLSLSWGGVGGLVGFAQVKQLQTSIYNSDFSYFAELCVAIGFGFENASTYM